MNHKRGGTPFPWIFGDFNGGNCSGNLSINRPLIIHSLVFNGPDLPLPGLDRRPDYARRAARERRLCGARGEGEGKARGALPHRTGKEGDRHGGEVAGETEGLRKTGMELEYGGHWGFFGEKTEKI